MLVKITNTYHNESNIVFGETLEKIKDDYLGGIAVTASTLAENEIEEDWADYYATEEDAFNATYDLIYEQLLSEITFEVLEHVYEDKELFFVTNIAEDKVWLHNKVELEIFIYEVLANDESYETDMTADQILEDILEQLEEEDSVLFNGYAVEYASDLSDFIEDIGGEVSEDFSGYFIQDLDKELDEIFDDFDVYIYVEKDNEIVCLKWY